MPRFITLFSFIACITFLILPYRFTNVIIKKVESSCLCICTRLRLRCSDCLTGLCGIRIKSFKEMNPSLDNLSLHNICIISYIFSLLRLERFLNSNGKLKEK